MPAQSVHHTHISSYTYIQTRQLHIRDPHHGLVVEREALHGAQGIGGAADFLEDDEGLAPHLQAPRHQDIQDLAKLGEDGIQGLLELCIQERHDTL